jgi:hypothetical protein
MLEPKKYKAVVTYRDCGGAKHERTYILEAYDFAGFYLQLNMFIEGDERKNGWDFKEVCVSIVHEAVIA